MKEVPYVDYQRALSEFAAARNAMPSASLLLKDTRLHGFLGLNSGEYSYDLRRDVMIMIMSQECYDRLQLLLGPHAQTIIRMWVVQQGDD